MGVTATFKADFTSFQEAVLKSSVTLQNLEANANKVGVSLNKMADQFTGKTVIQNAQLMTKAIEGVGGASTLTASEMAKVNSTVTEAIAKYTALGKVAPQSMIDLANATKATVKPTDDLSKSAESAQATTGSFTGSFLNGLKGLLPILSGAGLIGGVIALGKSALSFADDLKRMSDQTGISTTGIQRLGYAAGQSGNDLDQITQAISQMENRLASGDKSALKALGDVGLSFARLKSLSPDQQFIAVGEAIAKIPDPLQRTQAAMDLFGKSGAAILPTLTGNLRDLTDQADAAGAVLSEDAVKALDQFGDHMTSATTTGKVFIAEVFNGIIKDAGAVIDALKRVAGATDEIRNKPILTAEGKVRQTELITDMALLGTGMEHVTEQHRALSKQLSEAIAIKSFSEVVRVMKEMGATGELSGEQMQKIVKSAKDFGGQAALADPMIQGMIRGLEQIKPAASDAANFTDKSGEALKRLTDGLKALTPAQKQQIDQFKALGQSAADMAPLVHADVDIIDAYQKAQERAATATTKAESALQPFKAAMIELNSVSQNYGRTLGTVSDDVQEAVKFYLTAGISQETLAKAYGLTTIQVKAIATSLEISTRLFNINAGAGQNTADALGQVGKMGREGEIGLKDLSKTMQSMIQIEHGFAMGFIEAGKAGGWVVDVKDDLKELEQQAKLAAERTKQLAETFGQMGQIVGGTFGTLLAGFGRLIPMIEEATKAQEVLNTKGENATEAEKMNAALTKRHAIMGGILTAASAIANATEGATSRLGMMANLAAKGAALGAAFGPWGAAIGAAGGAILGVFQSAEKQINKTRAAFVEAAGGLDELRDKAFAAGKTLNALLNAKNAEQYEKAIKDLNQAFADTQTELEGIDKLKDRFATIGGALSDSMRESLRQLASIPGLSKDAAAALMGLANDTKPNFKELEKTAAEYGVTLSQLGAKFQQAHVSDEAAKIIGDFENLKNAGADVGAVLNGMADEVQHVVDESEKFGVDVPENMRPMIEAMINAGLLTDAAGKKITDISKIKFGAPVETEADKIAKAIKDLGELFEKLPSIMAEAVKGINNSLSNINTRKDIDIYTHHHDVYDNAGAVAGAAQGAFVGASGLEYLARGGPAMGRLLAFKPRGTDTVPAMLTPGEGVLNVAAMRRLGRGGLASLNSGGSVAGVGGSSNDEVVRELRALRAEMTQKLARAVRDEVQKARIGRR